MEHALSCEIYNIVSDLFLFFCHKWQIHVCLCMQLINLPSHLDVVPAVERIVYSTCSINQVENEDVIKSVLPLASSYGFELTTIFPQWPRRGHPIFDGCK